MVAITVTEPYGEDRVTKLFGKNRVSMKGIVNSDEDTVNSYSTQGYVVSFEAKDRVTFKQLRDSNGGALGNRVLQPDGRQQDDPQRFVPLLSSHEDCAPWVRCGRSLI